MRQSINVILTWILRLFRLAVIQRTNAPVVASKEKKKVHKSVVWHSKFSKCLKVTNKSSDWHCVHLKACTVFFLLFFYSMWQMLTCSGGVARVRKCAFESSKSIAGSPFRGRLVPALMECNILKGLFTVFISSGVLDEEKRQHLFIYFS